MTTDNPHTVREIAVLATAWLASITLSQWQAIVGIASGLAVLGYTLLRAWVLWRHRDKGPPQ